MFVGMVVRGIFGPRRKDIIGIWRKLHSERLYNLYYCQILLGLSNQGG
jgi:hypothetical protein